MASPESAPSTPPSNSDSSPPESSNSTSSSSPPPASPPPSPPTSSSSSPPQSKSPPPASPPPSSPPPSSSSSSPPPSPSSSSPPPSSSSPPPPPPVEVSPPPKDSPPPSATPSPPADSNSPPPTSTPAISPPHPSSPPPTNGATPPSNNTQPSPVFSPPPPGIIFSPTPPPPSEKVTPSPGPPPQRPGELSPPPPSKTSSTSSGSNESPSSSGSSTNGLIIIAGIVVGGLLLLAILIVMLRTRRKKKQHYYGNGRAPKPGDPHYIGSTPTQWNSPQPLDHIFKLPPPPGAMGTPSPLGVGGVGWGAPPPPHAANTSSEFSSGHSGQHQLHMGSPSPNVGGIGGGLGFSKSQFTYEELAAATGGFSQANLLGQGGFGYVHKGILPDGREVAVKSLKSGSGQGEREFQAEVEIISRVHHRHLVSLVGYCIAEGQRMLVYEYVSNKTLEFHLHGKGQPVMNWVTRLQIALGSAKGLAYIHEDCHPRIIHRDIKAANILLDDKYEAMVADFGLAKLSSDNYTHVSTRVMGTFGYLAPEYASSGKLTEKSDVFSFGVMLLELITGRKPVDPSGKLMEDSLVDWARPLLTKALEDGNYNELVDPRLEGNYVTHEMACMIGCASASIRHSARRRPKMIQIVRALEGDSSLEDLNDGTKTKVGSTGSNETQTYDTRMYNADMTKFRKMVMSSQEFASSEYGDTSEYGLNPSASSSDEFEPLAQHQQQKKP